MPEMSTNLPIETRLADESPSLPSTRIINDFTKFSSDPLPFVDDSGLRFLNKPLLTTVPNGRPRNMKTKTKPHASSSSTVPETQDLPFGIDFSDMLGELRTQLDIKRREEERLQKDITDILSQSTSSTTGVDMSRSFGLSVSRMNNNLLLVETDTKNLANSLKVVSKLADNISSKVSALDVAKTRVVECLQLAGDMRDLGVCSEGVDAAISEEEYEQAAQHIHRFLTLDQAVFQLRDAVDKEAGQSVRHSYDVLTAAAKRLKEILERRLKDAVEKKDVATMQRFVRLFPLINEHSSGLAIFGEYLLQELERLGQDNIKVMEAGGTDDNRRNVLYADTMFLFFEAVASVIEVNQPLIENSYGSDRLLDFIQVLQTQIDKTVDVILSEFYKRRQFDRKSKAVEKYLRNPDKVIDKPDALELDVLLSEVTQMHTRAEMYWRFLKRRIGETRGHDEDDDDLDVDEKRKRAEEKRVRLERREQKMDALLNKSVVGRRMQELMGRYILMEQFYMEETVSKAITMDQRESGQLTSSVVDDVLFIVRKSVRRALTSASVDCTCASINNGCTLLETTFHNYLAETVQIGYPSVGFAAEALQTAQTAYNVLQHGKTVTESGPDAQRDSFLTAVNNARVGCEMVGEMKKGLAMEMGKVQRSPVDSAKLEHSLSQFDEVVGKLRSLAEKAVTTLTQTAFRPKLKNSCEMYIDLNHCLSDDQLAECEATDPWIEQFIAQLDKNLASFQQILHEENYQSLLLCVCTEVCKQLERVIYKCVFNRLGGLQLDKEYRQLTSYLSGVAGWSARERCARLSQIVALLNVDTVEEAVDFLSHSVSTLSEKEVKKTLLLRSDLPQGMIQQISL